MNNRSRPRANICPSATMSLAIFGLALTLGAPPIVAEDGVNLLDLDCERLRLLLSRSGWRLRQDDEGNLLLIPGASTTVTPVPESAAAKPRQDDFGHLQALLESRGWRIERDPDGSLIFYPKRPPQQEPIPEPAHKAADAASADGLLQTLRNAGWRAERSDHGDLLLFPPQAVPVPEPIRATLEVPPLAPVQPPQTVSLPPAAPEPAPPSDTDGDGVPDADDLCPDSKAGVAVGDSGCAVALPVVLHGVKFESNSAGLTEGARQSLRQQADILKRLPPHHLTVLGHTDARGAAKLNLGLSRLRAEAVRAHLVGLGLPAERISAEGRGATEPVADNATPEGRDANRRVELVIKPL